MLPARPAGGTPAPQRTGHSREDCGAGGAPPPQPTIHPARASYRGLRRWRSRRRSPCGPPLHHPARGVAVPIGRAYFDSLILEIPGAPRWPRSGERLPISNARNDWRDKSEDLFAHIGERRNGFLGCEPCDKSIPLSHATGIAAESLPQGRRIASGDWSPTSLKRRFHRLLQESTIE